MNSSTNWTMWARRIAMADVVVIITAITLDLGWGTDQFGEMGIVTLLSVTLLLLCSWMAYRVFKIRFNGGNSWQVSATLWGFIALGCIFLAADEFFRIHESFDEWIHLKFGMQETAVSDRLDDVLILLYMLGALGIMAFYRNELRRFQRLWPWLVTGFSCATVMGAAGRADQPRGYPAPVPGAAMGKDRPSDHLRHRRHPENHRNQHFCCNVHSCPRNGAGVSEVEDDKQVANRIRPIDCFKRSTARKCRGSDNHFPESRLPCPAVP
ncbi:MAG: hypothetical protein AAGH72_09465 [Verrucomicrobiota bacterium]